MNKSGLVWSAVPFVSTLLILQHFTFSCFLLGVGAVPHEKALKIAVEVNNDGALKMIRRSETGRNLVAEEPGYESDHAFEEVEDESDQEIDDEIKQAGHSLMRKVHAAFAETDAYPTPPPTRKCHVDHLNGETLWVMGWSAAQRKHYCYKVVVGDHIWQSELHGAQNNADCKVKLTKTYYLGKYVRTDNQAFDTQNYAASPGRGGRKTTLKIDEDDNLKTISVDVSEPSVKIYEVDIRGPPGCETWFQDYPEVEPPTTTTQPTQLPTMVPTGHPTQPPTMPPTEHPTQTPTMLPTSHPTQTPTMLPTSHPTQTPTMLPTSHPTQPPTMLPTNHPTHSPTLPPTSRPASPVCAPYSPNPAFSATARQKWCTAGGDPHVTTFDGHRFHPMHAVGHWWLVHTRKNCISIQALYGGCGLHHQGGWHRAKKYGNVPRTCVTAIAIGGSFLKDDNGNDGKIIVRTPCDWNYQSSKCRNEGAKEPRITWNDDAVQLKTMGNKKTWSLDSPKISLDFSTTRADKMMEIKLPGDGLVKIYNHGRFRQANYRGTLFNVHIRMAQYWDGSATMPQCGHCGNYNSNKADDNIYEQSGKTVSSDALCHAEVHCSDRLMKFEQAFGSYATGKNAETCEENPTGPTYKLADCTDENKLAAEQRCIKAFAANGMKHADQTVTTKDTYYECVLDECQAPGDGFAEDDAEDAKDQEQDGCHRRRRTS